MTQLIENQQPNNTIEYLELSAGMGKTYTTIKWIVEEQIPQGERWVYIAPSKELLNETASLVSSLDYYDVSIITDDYVKTGVMVNTIERFQQWDDIGLFLITHANLQNILLKGEEHIFKGFNVVIDEVPSVLDMHDLSLSTETDIIRDRLVELEDSPDMFTLPRSKNVLEQLQSDGKRNGSVKISSFARALSTANIITRECRVGYTKYQTYNITDYSSFVANTSRCILLGAKISNTLTSCLLERQGISMLPFTAVTPSRSEYLNQQRVTIYYLTDEKVKGGCSSSILNSAYNIRTGKKLDYSAYRHLPNGIEDLSEGYVKVYQEYVDRACELLGDDFLYTVNYEPNTKEYKDVCYNDEPRGVCIPYGCHGLNKYSHYTKVLCLFCYKPAPLHRRVLDHLSREIEYPEITEHYIDLKMREASLQLCTRSALRDFSDTTKEITFVVPDISVANYIKDFHIPNCNIDNSIALYIPDNRKGNGGHNMDNTAREFSLDKVERQKLRSFKSYYKKTKGVPPSEEEVLVKINKIRGVK